MKANDWRGDFNAQRRRFKDTTTVKMNSHPDEIKWNGVDYVRKDIISAEVERRVAERLPSEEEMIETLKMALIGYVKKLDDGWEFILEENFKQIATDILDDLRSRMTEGGKG